MGLLHPDDLSAWRRARGARPALGRLAVGLRELTHDPRFELFIGGSVPTLLVALESTSVANRTAVLPPLRHVDMTKVAILAPFGAGPVLPQHPWDTKILFPEELPRYFDRMNAVLATSNHTDVGASAYDFSQAVNCPFYLVQSTLITSHSPPVPSGATLLGWSDADIAFWRDGSTHAASATNTVVGSQLLWAAAQDRIDEPNKAAPTTYLGQLQETALGAKPMAKAAEDFCLAYDAVYRPHPAETDRRARSVHERFVRVGIALDQSRTPLRTFDGPVVSPYSSGVLEAAARGLPAWVDFPQPPEWLCEVWERYAMVTYGETTPTPSPVITNFEPAYAIGITIDRHL
ncbi:MAG: hypothetical protein ACRCYU_16910 [Nocardioides sp.]